MHRLGYAIEEAFPAAPGGFPAATFAINVSGAFALGLFLIVVIERFPPSRYLRPFVATGFLGAYTTFSTFAVGIVTLAKDDHLPMAVTYAARVDRSWASRGQDRDVCGQEACHHEHGARHEARRTSQAAHDLRG